MNDADPASAYPPPRSKVGVYLYPLLFSPFFFVGLVSLIVLTGGGEIPGSTRAILVSFTAATLIVGFMALASIPKKLGAIPFFLRRLFFWLSLVLIVLYLILYFGVWHLWKASLSEMTNPDPWEYYFTFCFGIGPTLTPWLTLYFLRGDDSPRVYPVVLYFLTLFLGWLYGVLALTLIFPFVIAIKLALNRPKKEPARPSNPTSYNGYHPNRPPLTDKGYPQPLDSGDRYSSEEETKEILTIDGKEVEEITPGHYKEKDTLGTWYTSTGYGDEVTKDDP